MKSNRIFQHLAVTCAALAFAILPSQLTSVHAQSANFKLTQQSNNPTYIGNGSQTWTTYY